MTITREYEQFAAFLDVIERLGARHRAESIAFRDGSGNVIGLLTLEGGMVRFGVQVFGRVYIDEVFINEAPRHATALQKILNRASLTNAEKELLADFSPPYHAALCELTARALRKLAVLLDPAKQSGRRLENGLPQLRLLNLAFTPVELMLAAGRRGNLRTEDVAVRFYMSPPAHVEECWLFEWQLDAAVNLWPVQTNRLAERRISDIALYAELGQQNAKHMAARRRLGDRNLRRAQLLHFGEHFFYLVSSARYLTLLLYEQAHLGRILRAMEDFVAEAAVRVVEPATLLKGRSQAVLSTIPVAAMLQAASLNPALSNAELQPASSENALPAMPPSSQTPVMGALAQESVEKATPGQEAPSTLEKPASSAPPAETPSIAPAPFPDSIPATPVPAVAALVPPQLTVAPPSPDVSVPPEPLPKNHTAATSLLTFRNFTARVEGRVIFNEIDLEIGRKGVYVLLGPKKSGKSSLSGILSGRNRRGSGWFFSGEILYDGAPLGSSVRPAVVTQTRSYSSLSLRAYLLADLEAGVANLRADTQLIALLDRVLLSRLQSELDTPLGSAGLRLSASEWCRLAIARELIAEPKLLCLDEPTAGMDDADAAPLLSLMRAEGLHRTILFITRNQQHARLCSDYVILLSEGQLQECQSAMAFFVNPIERPAQDELRTSSDQLTLSEKTHEQSGNEPGQDFAAADSRFSRLAKPPASAQKMLRFVPVATHELPSPASVLAPADSGQALNLPSASVVNVNRPAVVWPCASPLLSIRGLTLKVGGRPVFCDLNFDVAFHGIFVIRLDSGGEKRLLLRLLCGPRPPNFELAGELRYLGQDLLTAAGPATPQANAQILMMKVSDYLASNLAAGSRLTSAEQDAEVRALIEYSGFPELFSRLDVELTAAEPMERRVLEILRAAAAGPQLLVLDDPCSGLSAASRERLLGLLNKQAQRRALLILTQQLEPYAELQAASARLTDGRLLDQAAESRILPAESGASSLFVVANPELSLLSSPYDARERKGGGGPGASFPGVGGEESRGMLRPTGRRGQGPRGFQWLRLGVLAGMPAPGLTHDLGYDLELTRQAGVSWLVTLTTEPLPAPALREYGLQALFFPIADMDAPSEEAAFELAQRVAALTAQHHAVAFHCKAGMGRTGTMLAAQLIFEGADARSALAQVRAVDPCWVQSERQIQFLAQYAQWLQRAQPFSSARRGS